MLKRESLLGAMVGIIYGILLIAVAGEIAIFAIIMLALLGIVLGIIIPYDKIKNKYFRFAIIGAMVPIVYNVIFIMLLQGNMIGMVSIGENLILGGTLGIVFGSLIIKG